MVACDCLLRSCPPYLRRNVGFSNLERAIYTTITGGGVSQKSWLWLFSMLSMVRLNIKGTRTLLVDKTPALLKQTVFWKHQLITGYTGKLITDTMFCLPFHKLLAGRVYITSARRRRRISAVQPSSARLRWFCFTSSIKQQGKALLVSHLYSWHKWRCRHMRWLPVNNAQWALLDSEFYFARKPISHDSTMVVYLPTVGNDQEN